MTLLKMLLVALALFLCGSCMFSYWLGSLKKKNLRSIGDGNPGAANLWKAAGFKWGLLGILLDFSKGYLPLFILTNNGMLYSQTLVLFALTPILGHLFSPFLRFRGGKGIAVTFGVWSAISHFEFALIYAIFLAFLNILTRMGFKGKTLTTEIDSLHSILGMLMLFGILILFGVPANLKWFCILNALLFLIINLKSLIRLSRNAFLKSNDSNLIKKEKTNDKESLL